MGDRFLARSGTHLDELAQEFYPRRLVPPVFFAERFSYSDGILHPLDVHVLIRVPFHALIASQAELQSEPSVLPLLMKLFYLTPSRV